MTKKIQEFSSKETSINKNKLPASTKKIDFSQFEGMQGLDIGGGKFDNLKDTLKDNYNIDLFIYDKFNRTETENGQALLCQPAFILCNNVLNVIKEDDIILDIIKLIECYNVPFFLSVYEGDKTGDGKQSKKGCFQRNQKIQDYVKFFTVDIKIKNGIIINN